MNTRHAFPAVLLAASIFVASHARSSDPAEPAPGAGKVAHHPSRRGHISQRPAWGSSVNPDGDCQFFFHPGALLISVPGSARAHDLAAEIGVTNAPRLMQAAQGDVTVQVCVDGRFSPGDESTLSGRTPYNGAGLMLMADPRNVVTLARAVLQDSGGECASFANFEIRTDGELQRFGQADDHRLPKSGPVFLRLERRGQRVLGAVSNDGVKWDSLEPKELPEAWPVDSQVGVVAISTSKEEFNPRFSQFQVLK